MQEDDVNLVRAAIRGQADAFTALVRNYKNFVFRTAYGVLQNKHDAEDVTQETFIKVHQFVKQLRDERTFPSWLARITVRTALDFVNRSSKHSWTSLEAQRFVTEKDPHQKLDFQLDLDLALRKLSHEQRTILVLREIHGFDYEELAQILDIPVGTVRSRLHHARLQLRSLLSIERRNTT